MSLSLQQKISYCQYNLTLHILQKKYAIVKDMSDRRSLTDGVLKLLFIIMLPVTALVGFFGYMTAKQTALQLTSEPTTILRVPVVDKQWTDIGTVFEPVINLGVQTPTGLTKTDFVLDSGAVISSLPREWAEKIGKDLAFAKRISFKGFGNTVSFAYQSDMIVQLGSTLVDLPVVFTESEGTRALLGRKGFFEQYSILFDHKQKVIEIQK